MRIGGENKDIACTTVGGQIEATLFWKYISLAWFSCVSPFSYYSRLTDVIVLFTQKETKSKTLIVVWASRMKKQLVLEYSTKGSN